MSEDYNVFISWSGTRSLQVAKALGDWLRKVIQNVHPWISETEIDKGTRSIDQIVKALAKTRVGIVCMTSENQDAPWLLFEAGACAKTIGEDKSRLYTYLIGGLRHSDVKQPLGMFQHTLAEKEETRKLVRSINKVVSESPLPEKDLDGIFDAMWPRMQEVIDAVPSSAPGATVKREVSDMVEEILELVRAQPRAGIASPTITWNKLGGTDQQVFAAIRPFLRDEYLPYTVYPNFVSRCACTNVQHGHVNPCGREGARLLDDLCPECADKAAKEWAKTQSGS